MENKMREAGIETLNAMKEHYSENLIMPIIGDKEMELKPGWELDHKVAIEVMGWTCDKYGDWDYKGLMAWRRNQQGANVSYEKEEIDYGAHPFPPPYSTDIAASWEVVEKMEELGYMTRVMSDYDVMNDRIVRRVSIIFPRKNEAVCGFKELGDIPTAICIVALKANTRG